MSIYFNKIGQPIPNVTVVALDGVATDPAAHPESTGEVMLDIDVAGALSGGAMIAVHFSTFDEKGLVDALSAVIEDSVNDPSVLSISWGGMKMSPSTAVESCGRRRPSSIATNIFWLRRSSESPSAFPSATTARKPSSRMGGRT